MTPENTEAIVDLNRIGMALADTRTEILSMLNAVSPLKTSETAVMDEFLASVANVMEALSSMGLALDQAQGNLMRRQQSHQE